MATQFEFHWLSALGCSVALFLIHGFFYVLIGVLTPIFWNKPVSGEAGLIISYRTDKKFFGDEPQKILRGNEPVYKLSQILLAMLAGMLVIAGLSIASIAWFGLKAGQTWAIYVLAIVGIAGFPFWRLVFKPYWDAGIL